ncbi:putative porin [bacterium]|nr:putative porin [bacterium]
MKKALVIALSALLALSVIAWADEASSTDDSDTTEAVVVQEATEGPDESYAGLDIADLMKIIEEQQSQIEELSERLVAVEGGLSANTEKVDKLKEQEPLPSWVPKVKVSGDLRYRYEHINKTGKKSRNRERVRARLGLTGKVNDQVDIKVRLASGSADPVSTNQTLDGAFSSKSIWLDRAYFDWHPSENMTVYGGKMSNPFFKPAKSQLLWDGDMNPEGLAVRFEGSGDTKPFLNVAHFWADERKAAADARILGAQTGLHLKGGSNTKATVGVGYYAFTNVEGQTPLVDATDSFGNSVNTDPNTGDITYTTGFREFEAFAEVTTKLGNTPFTVYGDYVTNTDADTDDKGWLVGANLGKAKNPGEWEFKYNYRRVEADAVLGAFCDSDFIGGGTDGKGHVLGLGVALTKNTSAGLTYFLNDAGLAGGKSYKRLQFDFKFKF